jgi:SAM-dependent methyltransferase
LGARASRPPLGLPATEREWKKVTNLAAEKPKSGRDARAPRIREAAFDAVAETYDRDFVESLIGRAQREVVWTALDRLFRPGQRILEINCGTGVDAVRLAGRGVNVVACDVSPRMIEVGRRRALAARSAASVEFRVLATEEIARVRDEAPFDGVLSNFAGLNCVRNWPAVARDLATLLRPQGVAVFCIFGRFCLWEVCWYLCRGRFGKAFRRLRPDGSVAQIGEDKEVRVYYPSVEALRRSFAADFRPVERRGVGVCVPPSYVEPLAQRFPTILRALAALDWHFSGLPVLRRLGDHTLVVLERDDRTI